MQDPGTEPRQSITDLVASCIEAVERDGLAAIERFCRDYPARATQIRQRLGILHTLGLLRPAVPLLAARTQAHCAAPPDPAAATSPARSEVDREPQ